MIKNIFKKEEKNNNNENIMIAALLIHAAKMYENYTEVEKKIIGKALMDLKKLPENEINEIVELAEKKEKNSNQIIEFTREIKKKDMKFRLSVVELLWKIIYSDEVADQYETNLVRRVCGLLYVTDRDNGEIKLKVQSIKNKK